jgi:hypothetical protein
MERKCESETQSVRFAGVARGRTYYQNPQYSDSPTARRDASRRTRLSSIVRNEIAPRLNLLHHGIHFEAPSSRKPLTREIIEFAALTMLTDNEAAFAYFHHILAQNYSVETLFVYLLAPAAHYLAALLNEDRCDPIDFTMGMARLRQLLLVFGKTEEPAFGERDQRALVISENDESHIFDRDLAVALLRGAGWDTSAHSCWSVKAAETLVAREWFGILNLTLDNSSDLQAAAAIINGIRRVSCNESIRVMTSGVLFAGNPGLAAQIGADAAAPDAVSAVILAKKLLAERAMA